MSDHLFFGSPELNALRRFWSAQGYLFEIEMEDRPATFNREFTITMARVDARGQSVIAVPDGMDPFPYIRDTLGRLATRMTTIPAPPENRRGVLRYLVKMGKGVFA